MKINGNSKTCYVPIDEREKDTNTVPLLSANTQFKKKGVRNDDKEKRITFIRIVWWMIDGTTQLSFYFFVFSFELIALQRLFVSILDHTCQIFGFLSIVYLVVRQILRSLRFSDSILMKRYLSFGKPVVHRVTINKTRKRFFLFFF